MGYNIFNMKNSQKGSAVVWGDYYFNLSYCCRSLFVYESQLKDSQQFPQKLNRNRRSKT